MRWNRGFTLIEILVVIAITGIVASIAALILNAGINSYFSARQLSDISTEGDMALNRMVAEIKEAVSITTISATQLIFINNQNETITYQFSGTNLTRTLNSDPTYNLANHIDAATTTFFRYFNANHATTATASSVRLISINIDLLDGNNQAHLITAVSPRNLS